MKRGHSNIRAKEITRWKNTPDLDCACLPLHGGATASSTKELPPLALHPDEWLEIGRRMGWITDDQLANGVLDVLARRI